jgi:hypothetical protein
MAFDAFRRHLTSDHRSVGTGQPLGTAAASDYVSRLRRLEKILQTPLENAAPMILRALAEGLAHDTRVIAAEVPRKVVGDIAVALRSYANFIDASVERTMAGSSKVDHALDQKVVVRELNSLGFVTKLMQSGEVIELHRKNLTLYVKSDDGRQPVVVHPLFEKAYSTLANLPGTIRDRPLNFYYNPNLLKFPKRDPGGRRMRYGIAFGFASEVVLRSFVDELEIALTMTNPMAPEKTLGDELDELETEKSLLTKARIGQGRFRADLLRFWQGHCALTDVSAPELLRASHIKSWRDSSNNERLDAFNGLLLAVHLDALFDRALISFGNAGEMLISKRLQPTEREVFGLISRAPKILLTARHLEYMDHHRERFHSEERKY